MTERLPTLQGRSHTPMAGLRDSHHPRSKGRIIDAGENDRNTAIGSP